MAGSVLRSVGPSGNRALTSSGVCLNLKSHRQVQTQKWLLPPDRVRRVAEMSAKRTLVLLMSAVLFVAQAMAADLVDQKNLPKWVFVGYDDEEFNIIRMDNPNERLNSFRRRGIGKLPGEIKSCRLLVDVPVGTARGNHSFGGYCIINVKKSDLSYMICDDEMVGRFSIKETHEKNMDMIELGRFVRDKCFGG